jgi:hypothetical protein
MWTFRAIVISALAMGLASDSWAYLFRGLPACPWYSPSHTWTEYLAGKYGIKPSPRFSIKFDHLSHNIGNIQAGRCYTVGFENDRWYVAGPVAGQNRSNADNYGGANPQDGKMNIWGVIMTFDNEGHVFGDQDGLIGTMKCTIGPDC